MARERKNTNLERLLAKIKPTDDPNGCWLFLGTKNKKGYGKIWDSLRREMVYAHRMSYELFVGPIEDSKHIHHNCYCTSCVNYHHEEQKDNARNSGDHYIRRRKKG